MTPQTTCKVRRLYGQVTSVVGVLGVNAHSMGGSLVNRRDRGAKLRACQIFIV